MKKYLLYLLLISALVTGCRETVTNDPQQRQATGRQGQLLVRGEFAALDENLLSPPFSTEVLHLAPEGSRVKAGDEIARLSPGNRIERLKDAKQDLDRLQLTLEREKKLVEMNDQMISVSLELAGLDLKARRIEFERAEGQRDWLRILELEESVNSEKVRRKMLEKKLAAGVNLAARGFAARQEVVSTRKDLDVLNVTASLSSRLILHLKETPDDKNLFNARQELEKASLKYNVASFTLAKTAADYLVNFNAARLEYQHAASSVAELEQQIASLSIFASADGVVIHGDTYDGAQFTKVKEGSQVFPGIYFMRTVNPARSGVSFSVDQRDAPLVATGSHFWFRADAYPEILLKGQFYSTVPIALEISGSNSNNQRSHVGFKASVASYPEFFRIGYSGTVYTFDFSTACLPRFMGNRRTRPQRKAFRRLMSTTGDVKPAKADSIFSGIDEGKLNQLVEEGKGVKKGDTLAVIGSDKLSQDITDTEIELKKKIEEYDLMVQKNAIEKDRLDRSLDVKRSALEVARLKHASLLKSRDEDKIVELKRALELVEARMALAREKISHTRELRQKGLSSEIDLMNAETELAALEKEHAISAYKLENEDSGPTRRSVMLSEIDVRRAELDLEKTRLEVEMSLFRNQMEEKIQKSAIIKTEQNLENLRQQQENATIKAPSDGVVVHNEFHKAGGGLGKAKVGEKISKRIPFAMIADSANLQVHASLSEMDLKFLKPGDEVKVKVKSASVRTFPGWINSVGLVAVNEFPKRQDNVVSVVIDLLNPEKGINKIDEAFRPGVSCEVEFTLYDLADALVVPYDALLPTATATCVVNPDRTLRPVELEFSDGLNGAVVKSGLNAGDEILLQEPLDD